MKRLNGLIRAVSDDGPVVETLPVVLDDAAITNHSLFNASWIGQFVT